MKQSAIEKNPDDIFQQLYRPSAGLTPVGVRLVSYQRISARVEAETSHLKGIFSRPKHSAIFPCPYSLAILLLTREWGQGNKESGSDWVLYGKMLYRHADDQVFDECRSYF